MKRITSFNNFLNEAANPSIYKAPDGSKRAKTLEKVRELLKGSKEDKKKAYKLRDEGEFVCLGIDNQLGICWLNNLFNTL